MGKSQSSGTGARFSRLSSLSALIEPVTDAVADSIRVEPHPVHHRAEEFGHAQSNKEVRRETRGQMLNQGSKNDRRDRPADERPEVTPSRKLADLRKRLAVLKSEIPTRLFAGCVPGPDGVLVQQRALSQAERELVLKLEAERREVESAIRRIIGWPGPRQPESTSALSSAGRQGGIPASMLSSRALLLEPVPAGLPVRKRPFPAWTA